MASIVLNLDSRSKSSLPQVRIRISHNHTAAFIATGVMVEQDKFIGLLHDPIAKDVPMYDEKSYVIRNYINKYENVIFDLNRSGGLYNCTATDIRNLVLGDGAPSQKGNALFIEHIKRYGSSRKLKYKLSFEYTANTIQKFAEYKKIRRELRFNDINYAFISDLETYLTKNGLKIGSRGVIMRNIRTVYNDAIKRGIASEEVYPFDDFKIKKAKRTGKVEYLSVKQIRKLLSLDFTSLSGCMSLTRARDIFMISFYLCGANLVDIFGMEKMPKDEVVFHREKIDYVEPDDVHIKILPELKKLINKYKGKEHMFNFCEGDSCYLTFQRNLADRFQMISKLTGFKVNMAICRHTWATLCHKNGIEIFTIDKSLGHVDSDVTPIYYVDYDWSKTDDANRLLCDMVWRNVEINSIPVRY